MKIAILKYNAGNVRSVIFALRRLGVEPVWTDDPVELQSADKVIFPGVGEARSAMQYLRQRGLDVVLKALNQPLLGICLGLQLMCDWTEENDTHGLGTLPYAVKRFRDVRKVPHIGWNAITNVDGGLFSGISNGAFVYFVHSYYAECGTHDAALTEYGVQFASAIQLGNLYAVQFHPEKSGSVGQRILENFLAL